MKKTEEEIANFREKIRKGLELTFQKLLSQKKAKNGMLVLSEKGEIKKIKASDISN